MTERPYIDDRYPLSALTARIIAAAREVHWVLGPGFREIIYQRALAKELQSRQVENSREVWINVPYKGVTVGRMRVDLIAGDSTGDVMIEVKALGELRDVDLIQALSYLKASGYPVGLLINFGGRELQVKRLANQPRPVA